MAKLKVQKEDHRTQKKRDASPTPARVAPAIARESVLRAFALVDEAIRLVRLAGDELANEKLEEMDAFLRERFGIKEDK